MLNYKKILTERPVMFLMLVSVFSLIVGFTLVLQSNNALTYMSRANSRFENLVCPVGTTPLFQNGGLLTEQNLGIPGTKIISYTGNWRILKREDIMVATNGKTMDLQFPKEIMINKVLVYGNDDRANTKKGPWSINGEVIQGMPNKQQPLPVDLMNKGPFLTLNFDAMNDYPNFNTCISYAPTKSPTPTVDLTISATPSASITASPSASISPSMPVSKPISCQSLKIVVAPETPDQYLAVMPDNPDPFYFVTIYKDGDKLTGPVYGGNNATTNIKIEELQGKNYKAYVSRKPNTGYSTSPNCEINVPTNENHQPTTF